MAGLCFEGDAVDFKRSIKPACITAPRKGDCVIRLSMRGLESPTQGQRSGQEACPTCLSTCARKREKAGEAGWHYVCSWSGLWEGACHAHDHGLGFSPVHRSLPSHLCGGDSSWNTGSFCDLGHNLGYNHLSNFKVCKTKYVIKTISSASSLLLLLRCIWKVREHTGDKSASA